MRWKHFVRSTLALSLSVGLVACGGDDDPTGPGDDGDELSEAEAQLMMEALVDAGGLFVFSSGGGGPQAVTQAIDNVVSCPQGGSIALDGTLDIDDETGDIDWNVTQTHQSCVATASDNSTWTFDGDPNITIAFDASFEADNSFSVSGSQTGGIAYSNGSKSGSCTIDISYDFSGSQSGQTYSGQVSGTVCGVDYTYSTSID